MDFLFFKLTFLFLATGADDLAAGLLILLLFVLMTPEVADGEKVSITSISTRMLEAGSWSTVHCGTVTGC